MMDNNTSMEKENFFTNGKQKITPIEIGREMQDSFLQYAMSVIVAGRAGRSETGTPAYPLHHVRKGTDTG